MVSPEAPVSRRPRAWRLAGCACHQHDSAHLLPGVTPASRSLLQASDASVPGVKQPAAADRPTAVSVCQVARAIDGMSNWQGQQYGAYGQGGQQGGQVSLGRGGWRAGGVRTAVWRAAVGAQATRRAAPPVPPLAGLGRRLAGPQS